jgi:hypothetical protein
MRFSSGEERAGDVPLRADTSPFRSCADQFPALSQAGGGVGRRSGAEAGGRTGSDNFLTLCPALNFRAGFEPDGGAQDAVAQRKNSTGFLILGDWRRFPLA